VVFNFKPLDPASGCAQQSFQNKLAFGTRFTKQRQPLLQQFSRQRLEPDCDWSPARILLRLGGGRLCPQQTAACHYDDQEPAHPE
jgi:hypothetical protein